MLASAWIQYGGNFTLLPGSNVTVVDDVLVPTVGDTTPPLPLVMMDSPIVHPAPGPQLMFSSQNGARYVFEVRVTDIDSLMLAPE